MNGGANCRTRGANKKVAGRIGRLCGNTCATSERAWTTVDIVITAIIIVDKQFYVVALHYAAKVNTRLK